jgi:RNA polymerase sigma-70 factor (ECF subfamily)
VEGLTSEQELQLVKQAQNEIAAFSKLYQLYLPKLYNYAFYRTGSKQEAEDVVSSTFIKALEHLKKEEIKYISFKNWLYKVCSNIIIDNWRKSSYAECALPCCFDNNDVDFSGKIDDKLTILQILYQLTEEQQQVLLLRYVQDLSICQVAEIMGKSEGAVKQLAYRGLNNMKERMAKSNG